MDTVDKKTRSRIMSSVGQYDTGPELRLRKSLHRRGLRYRTNVKQLAGSPDLVFPKYNAVIFVHGCFWHRHGCKYTTTPSTRHTFWMEKFRKNKNRDRRNVEMLLDQGWRAMIVWECIVKQCDTIELAQLATVISDWLSSGVPYEEISPVS